MILVCPAQLLTVPDIVARLEYRTWLLERRLTPRYGYVGTTREGSKSPHQGLDPQGMPFSASSLMGWADWAVSSQQLSSRSSSFRTVKDCSGVRTPGIARLPSPKRNLCSPTC
ncbi:hypothetical protein B0H13DRAFT_1943547 [Mycena leptocephala]|nr:hypothetical protein B0H13DRAFT_1943547 [Mycena leptocephala]